MNQTIFVVNDGNYALLHEVKQRRSESFQNMMIDEQYVIVGMLESSDIASYLGDWDPLLGLDNMYTESLIYFAPNDQASTVRERIEQILSSWSSGTNIFGDLSDTVSYIAFRKTPSGLWIFVSDDCMGGGEPIVTVLSEVCDDLNPVVISNYESDAYQPCSPTTLYFTSTPEESGGPDFINSIARQNNPILQLMISEGLIDSEVDLAPEEE